MEKPQEKLQWALSVGIYHGPSFGHRIEMWHGATVREPIMVELGWWKGLGIPEHVLQHASTMVHAALVEHLVTRYGVQGELPMKWSGDPEPF